MIEEIDVYEFRMLEEDPPAEITPGHVVLYIVSGHLNSFGGYPYGHEWVGDELVVASLDNAKDRCRTQIDRYPVDLIRQWATLTSEAIQGEEFDSLAEALRECSLPIGE